MFHVKHLERGKSQMIMNRAEVYDILEQFPKVEFNNLSLRIYNQDTQQPEIVEDVITYEYFKFYLQRRYGSWLHLYPDKCPYCAYASFKESWERFVSLPSNLENWSKLYMSYFYRYNPIENYDRISSVTTEYKGKEKNSTDYTGTEKNITSFSGSETTTNSTPEEGYTDTSTSLRSPEDSAEYVPVDKVETHISSRADTSKLEFSEGRENSSSREFDERNDTTEKSFENRKDEVTEHTHGNIGVSTVADMTLKTLEMIKYNVSDYILDQFAKEYLLFWG